MASERDHPVDWRPYRAVGAMLVLALALNVWTRNSLWTAYTTIGLGLLMLLAGCVRTFGWRVPPAALWMAGATAALHYLGGSLSGLHSIGGLNGMYYVFPWWDNVAHALGASAVAIAAYAFLHARLRGAGAVLLSFLAVASATLAGVLVELYEFAGFLFFDTVDQGFYTNTLLDLYYNLLGALAGSIAYARIARAAEARTAASPPVATA